MFKSFVAIVIALLWLTGCGTTRLVDTDVRSYASAPLVPAGARYRFERLPSQQAPANAEQQSQLEALVQPALAKVGLQRDDAAAGYSVQVSVDIKVDPYSPWDRSIIGWGPGFNLGWGMHSGRVLYMGHYPYWGMSTFGVNDLPYYWRQVSIIIRDLISAQVVYETHAAHDGTWSDSAKVLPAMFEAALQGFPNPPQDLRHIKIEVPR